MLIERDKVGLETLIKNKEILLKFNQFRLDRGYEFMSHRTSLVFRILPFLLHINHHSFPGYVESPAVPCGIKLYTVTPETKSSLRLLFPKVVEDINNIEQSLPRQKFIRSLLLMGSIGSIAQNKKSDYDFWVCIHEEHFKNIWIDRFNEKLRLIEDWAERKHGIEVHFFITDIKKARENIFGESDKESAGSSQARLLKEELYRTMILVAGKAPVWWIMPPGVDDEEYTRLKNMLYDHPDMGNENFIDLGNLYELSHKEVFGSALWQINKAMDSPFKSVLKMGFLESYSDAKVDNTPLCARIKKKLFDSEGKKLFFDPYMLMFNRVLKYYKRTEDDDVLNLLCTCFYIKIAVNANYKMLRNKEIGLKEKTILNYAREWGWSQAKLDDLNSYKEWSFRKVLQLGMDVHAFMVKVYKRLTDQMKEKAFEGHVITEKDMTILGRKLFTFYSKKPNKVMGLRKAFDDGFLQEELTLHAVREKSRKIMWSLYKGQLRKIAIVNKEAANKMILRHRDLCYMITWMVFNQILDRNTRISITQNFTNVHLTDIQKFVKELFAFFPTFEISYLSSRDLLSEAKKAKIFVLINFFSEKTKWEIESVILIYLNTWGELFYEKFLDPDKGIEKLNLYIREMTHTQKAEIEDYINIFIPKGTHYISLMEKTHHLIKRDTGLQLNLEE